MKKYLVEYHTDYCDDCPEIGGSCIVEANTEEEAVKNFYKQRKTRAAVIGVQEVGDTDVE